jgi:uncharacterized Zn-finger protein
VEGERPFVCPTCGETFQSKTELVEHSHIHADEKSFVCRYLDLLALFSWFLYSCVRVFHAQYESTGNLSADVL